MTVNNHLRIIFLMSIVPGLGWAAKAPVKSAENATTTETVNGVVRKTRYKSSQAHNFDAQTVQGALKRPETSVVTGNQDEIMDGLLSLRENFIDHAQSDAGVEHE